MEQIDPDAVELPAWYRPNPGLARDLAFVAFSTAGGELVAKQITNYRWALSAFGTASTAALGRGDTVYCLTPLHHESGPAGQPRRRSGGRRPHRAVSRSAPGPVRRRSAPVRGHSRVVHVGDAARCHRRPGVSRCTAITRCGCSSARVCRPACGSGSSTCSRRHMSSSSSRPPMGRQCWLTCPAPRSAARARPLPGAGHVELGAYDADNDLILENDRGLVRMAGRRRGRRAARPPARTDRSDRVGQTWRLRPGRHLDFHRVSVPPRCRWGFLAGGQARLGGAHRTRHGVFASR